MSLNEFLENVSYTKLKSVMCAPKQIDADTFSFYVVNVSEAALMLQNLARQFGYSKYEVEECAENVVLEVLSRVYEAHLSTHQAEDVDEDVELNEDLLEVSSEVPVIKLVNQLLSKSVSDGASDIHFEAHEKKAIIRYRIDGLLYTLKQLPCSVYPGLVSRIKVLAALDIAETRLPQDGRLRLQIGGRIVDFRISTLPSAFGERVVLRILDQSSGIPKLTQLGFSELEIGTYRSFLSKSTGLILVTGPTGSGKTTTLYSSLQELVSESQNIITLEDPIEYQLDNINQIQVNPQTGLTFSAGLRTILRQDPDVILVGEIRDAETAMIAIQAALTGHLVFSTLHTTDSVNAITRLIDLGIEPFLVSSAVVGIVAQRLFRKVCPHCHKTTILDETSKLFDSLINVNEEVFVSREVGCERCAQTGYAGRIGAYEILPISDSLQHCITARASAIELREEAQRNGVVSLTDSACRLLNEQLTTPEELLRVLSSSF